MTLTVVVRTDDPRYCSVTAWSDCGDGRIVVFDWPADRTVADLVAEAERQVLPAEAAR
jgi:hypothetical protein